jgi:hypothetical protein
MPRQPLLTSDYDARALPHYSAPIARIPKLQALPMHFVLLVICEGARTKQAQIIY